MKRVIALTSLMAVCAFLAGCTPEIVSARTQSQPIVSSEPVRLADITPVLVLAPRLKCERMKDEAPLATDPAMEQYLLEATVAKLTAKGVTVGQTLAMPAELANELPHVLSQRTDEKSLHDFGTLGSANSCTAVLVQSVLIRRGNGSFQFLNVPDPPYARSSAHFRVALLESASGRKLWENTVLVRWVESDLLKIGPKAGDDTMRAALNQLYSTLTIQP